MDLDVVTLSRAQFALTVMFHYLFPPLSIGLGLVMVIGEGLFLRTGDRHYEALVRFLTKLFAVNFAVGVATGIVMEFQFGTNWATYSRFVGDVFGSALAAEGIFAFFLESGFLAILVFGWERVSPKMHFFATLMVFLGSTFSATWIVIANSWQHTPAGFVIEGEGEAARARITDFWAMIFNPSAMHRLGHVVLGSFLVGAFFVASVCAFYLRRERHRPVAERGLKIGVAVALVTSLLMLVSGHSQARMVHAHQPAKLAAFEGLFHTEEGPTGLYLMGWPDEEAETVRFGIEIPAMLSFLVHDDFSTPIEGLDRVPPDERPPVVVPFVSYHLMVALGMAMLGLAVAGALLWWRGSLTRHRLLLTALVPAVIFPYVANQAGWVASEVGRQPWVVYGLLRTRDAVSATVPAEQVLISIVLFSLVYLGLLAVWLFVMNEKIQHGPESAEELEVRASLPPPAKAALVLDESMGHDEGPPKEITEVDLALAWYVGLGILLTVYAVLDGYDLGVGALHLFWRTDHERRLSLNSIGPLWDGNEVWLVTFGGALFSGFPEAYATILSALYLPFMFLLFFLIGRAVAIELRSKHHSKLWRGFWDFSFAASSTLTVFTFGVFAGNLLHGIPVDERGFIHVSVFALFGPFPVLVGLLAVAGAAMHGAAFLWRKLEGEMAERARRLGLGAAVLFFVMVLAVTAATLALAPHATHNFGAAPVAWLVPVIGSIATVAALAAFVTRRDTAAFASTSVTIVMLCTLFGLAMFPHLLFSTHSDAASLDLWESSSSPTTLRIMSIIALIGAPLVIVYTVIVHYVFRGKVKLGKFSY